MNSFAGVWCVCVCMRRRQMSIPCLFGSKRCVIVCNSRAGAYSWVSIFKGDEREMVTRGDNVRERREERQQQRGRKTEFWEEFTLTAMIDLIFPNWHIDLGAYVLRLYWVCSLSVMFNKLPDWLSGCVIVPSGYGCLQNRERTRRRKQNEERVQGRRFTPCKR